MEQNKKEEIKAVIANASNVYVASVDEKGYLNIKAMFARMQQGRIRILCILLWALMTRIIALTFLQDRN